MNHIYRVVRNRAGCIIVTGESAKSHKGISEKKSARQTMLVFTAFLCSLAVVQTNAGEICAFQSGTTSTSSALGSGAIACGTGNGAPGTSSVALGNENVAQSTEVSVIGYGNKAQSGYTSAIGYKNTIG